MASDVMSTDVGNSETRTEKATESIDVKLTAETKEGDKKTEDDVKGSHSSAVAKHYNELQETGLETRAQSRIFYLRNFHNWMKSMLIADTLQKLRKAGDHRKEISVLDLCSGKGGDLRKWEKGRINKLICADIAETSVEQGEDRYRELVQRNNRDRYPRNLFTAEFIAADCTKIRLKDFYKDPQTQFDLVSCQFSFHYCFESYPQADVMLRNACECLQPGGYFIGTTPNSQEIMRRLKDSSSNSFGNDVYRVTFPEQSEESEEGSSQKLFGAKYDFHLEGVVDCPEFLVYFPVLEKMAESHGMKLIYTKPFAEFYEEFKDEGEGRSLLGKMQALEPYPPDRDSKLMGEENTDYSHVKQKLDELEKKDDDENQTGGNTRRHSLKLGTLSQAEWEATTLYLAFVFQKVEGMASVEEQPTASLKEQGKGMAPVEEQPTASLKEQGKGMASVEEQPTASSKEQGTKRLLERETTEDEPKEKLSKAE